MQASLTKQRAFLQTVFNYSNQDADLQQCAADITLLSDTSSRLFSRYLLGCFPGMHTCVRTYAAEPT